MSVNVGTEIKEVKKHSRFRAYQIGTAGSSFSYYCGKFFTLVEGRITDHSRESVSEELALIGKDQIDTLHITSWDQDHCSLSQLEEICENYSPRKIEYPGYPPKTDSGKSCLKFIRTRQMKNTKTKAIRVDPKYIDSLNATKSLVYRDVFYHPTVLVDNPNDNSTVKLFRQGSFSVLSLGDVESSQISARIRRQSIVQRETDVLILPHHGANDDFLTKKFLKTVKPRLAVCCVDFDNQYEHPKTEVRELLKLCGVELFTTKTGDVIIESSGNMSKEFVVRNLTQSGNKVSTEKTYTTKRGPLFSMNHDSIRNRQRGNKRY
jgi:competence protein ComEC